MNGLPSLPPLPKAPAAASGCPKGGCGVSLSPGPPRPFPERGQVPWRLFPRLQGLGLLGSLPSFRVCGGGGSGNEGLSVDCGQHSAGDWQPSITPSLGSPPILCFPLPRPDGTRLVPLTLCSCGSGLLSVCITPPRSTQSCAWAWVRPLRPGVSSGPGGCWLSQSPSRVWRLRLGCQLALWVRMVDSPVAWAPWGPGGWGPNGACPESQAVTPHDLASEVM